MTTDAENGAIGSHVAGVLIAVAPGIATDQVPDEKVGADNFTFDAEVNASVVASTAAAGNLKKAKSGARFQGTNNAGGVAAKKSPDRQMPVSSVAKGEDSARLADAGVSHAKRTHVCKFYLGGRCKRGYRCPFAHAVADLLPLSGDDDEELEHSGIHSSRPFAQCQLGAGGAAHRALDRTY